MKLLIILLYHYFLNDKRVAQQNVSLIEETDKIIYFETSLRINGLIEAQS